MTKHDFHHFQVHHFNNVFEQSWCHCRVGATPARRSNCLQMRRIHHQVKYWRLNANTCIVAAILFSGHHYIGRHGRNYLLAEGLWIVDDQYLTCLDVQSTGAIPTRFGVTVLSTSLYSCNFLRERRIEIKFLPISSTVYFAPEDQLDLQYAEACSPVCSVTICTIDWAIFTAENLAILVKVMNQLTHGALVIKLVVQMWKFFCKDSRAWKWYYDNLFTAHISIYRLATEYRHEAIVASTIVVFNWLAVFHNSLSWT